MRFDPLHLSDYDGFWPWQYQGDVRGFEVECGTCVGKGWVNEERPRTCESCDGARVVLDLTGEPTSEFDRELARMDGSKIVATPRAKQIRRTPAPPRPPR